MQILLIALTLIMVLATDSHYKVVETISVYGVSRKDRTEIEKDNSIPSN